MERRPAQRNDSRPLPRRVSAGLPRADDHADPADRPLRRDLGRAGDPAGRRDLDHYLGAVRQVRAEGGGTFFETTAVGEPVVEHPAPGEVVWRDDAGVTCRRWNRRQRTRTRLPHDTTREMFVLDAPGPVDDTALKAAGDQLVEALTDSSPGVTIASRPLDAAWNSASRPLGAA
ncbi:hypothetical protein [Streptomyces hygroscopicus]|uniref:hypothetical protein n=1 Tax=Streptomyces hygroscopicus TaxID=1912 RepID=UPI000767CBC4|nr:hypothetical protein [Streptomyces hygroscopicus]